MGRLKERLDEVDRNTIVQDVVTLLDEEVNDKSGLTGIALKGGYNAVKKLQKGKLLYNAVDDLLDEFVEALDPMYEDYLEQSTHTTFEGYLSNRREEASNALLNITDRRAQGAENKFLKKTYSKLRGQAGKHVKEALPRVGRLIDKHT